MYRRGGPRKLPKLLPVRGFPGALQLESFMIGESRFLGSGSAIEVGTMRRLLAAICSAWCVGAADLYGNGQRDAFTRATRD